MNRPSVLSAHGVTGRMYLGLARMVMWAVVWCSVVVARGQSITITAPVSGASLCAGSEITMTFSDADAMPEEYVIWLADNEDFTDPAEIGVGSSIEQVEVGLPAEINGQRWLAIGSDNEVPDLYSNMVMIVVSTAPSAGLLSGDQEICIGGSTTFESTVNGGSWSSSNTGVATVNSSSGAISGVGAGTATITYTVDGTGGCDDATATRMVVVTDLTSAISYTGSPYCTSAATASVALTGTSGGTYSSTPAGLLLNPTSGSVSPGASTPGTYTVTYTVPATGGCDTMVTTAQVTIVPVPAVPVVSSLGVDTVCHGQMLDLRVVNEYAAGTTYEWTATGASAQIVGGANAPACTINWQNAPPQGGPTGATVTAQYTVTTSVGGCSSMVSGTVAVSNYFASCPKGIVFFEPNGLAVIDPVANHFQWGALDVEGAMFTALSGEVHQTLFRPQLAPLAGGLPVAPPYVVRSSIYPDKCFSYTTLWVDQQGLDRACLAPTEGMATEPGHTIYPNPADGKSLTVEATGPPLEEPLRFELYDMQGRLVHAEQVLVRPIARLAGDLSGLGRGMYMVRLRSSGSEENVKLILD